MHKQHIKVTYLLFLGLLVQIGCTAVRQTGKTLVPSKGIVEFKKTGAIVDQEKFDGSSKLFKERLRAALTAQAGEAHAEVGSTIDSLQLEFLLSQLNLGGQFVEQVYLNKETHGHKFQDSLIIGYQKSNGELVGDYTVVYREEKVFSMLAKIDSATFYLKKRPYPYSTDTILSIREYRDDTKTISGYKCFKLVFTAREDFEDMDSPYRELLGKVDKTFECYVTNEIKSYYHPILKYESILKNYYPLEIKELSSLINGMEINYQPTIIDL